MSVEINTDVVSLSMTGTINGATSYNYSYEFTGDSNKEYRLRLFLDYSRNQDYLDDMVMTGLYANRGIDNPYTNDMVSYDDWYCSFRSPMIDSEFENGHTTNFNSEITLKIGSSGTVYLQGYYKNNADMMIVQSDGDMQYLLGGASCIGESTKDDAPSFLVEYKDSESTIKRIEHINGMVTVTTKEPHGFATGDAITISGLPMPDNDVHATGKRGERYNGTYFINVVDEKTFTYSTQFYNCEGQMSIYGNNDNYVASKWISCSYSVEKSIKIYRHTATIEIPWENHDFVKGDSITISIGDYAPIYNAVVDAVTDSAGIYNTVICKCEPGDVDQFGTDGVVSATLYYSGRVPSSIIPVNYPEDVDNRTAYDHTMTTIMCDPVEDTFFDKKHDGETFSTNSDLKVANDSVVAFKICPTSVSYSTDARAEIRFFISGTSEVKSTLGLYLMKSNDWAATTTYNDIQDIISDTPISICEFNNDTCSDGDLGYYTFTIPTETVQEWVKNGTSVISLAICAYSTMGDNGYVYIASNESTNPIQLILSTGKSSVMDPEMIDVKVVPGNASSGDIVSIMVDGYGQFSDYAQNNVVMFNDIRGIIVSGDQKSIKVIVPEGVNGNCFVTVYTNLGDHLIQYTNTTTMTIMGSLLAKNKKLAEKKRPGEIVSKVSNTALYCRDLGFNNFTEITDENSLIQNVYSILLTRRGERLFNSDFGTTIEDRIFSMMSEYDENAILKECYAAVEKYEPRVEIDYEASYVDVDYDSNSIIIYLGLILPDGNATYITLPFKNRGVMV